MLDVEDDLVSRLAARSDHVGTTARVGPAVAGRKLDPAQQKVVAALGGSGELIVIEGAAAAGKTTTLAAVRTVVVQQLLEPEWLVEIEAVAAKVD